MTRGNQRDVDRMRNAKRNEKKGVGKKMEGSAQQRKEKDAQALQEKIAKKKAQEEEGKGKDGKK
eukprot:CAMPEP_0113897694 /NCGR_PEP_ID=MMETSP0780_2-20120614/18871_1 /TAXON_ID=652834 /ORGANISM="Palpitomonas bilix" /LENGTH=63 /DNA_ID=CAMNT_0000889285 /DNA_START=69 /DNA_END=260 /DNA_ORIENTATION=- /assembly_acc=CAM_ASM_000599